MKRNLHLTWTTVMKVMTRMMTLNETSVVHLYSKDTHPVLLTVALERFGSLVICLVINST